MARSLISGRRFGHIANVERYTLECRCKAFSLVARCHMCFKYFLLQFIHSFIQSFLSFFLSFTLYETQARTDSASGRPVRPSQLHIVLHSADQYTLLSHYHSSRAVTWVQSAPRPVFPSNLRYTPQAIKSQNLDGIMCSYESDRACRFRHTITKQPLEHSGSEIPPPMRLFPTRDSSARGFISTSREVSFLPPYAVHAGVSVRRWSTVRASLAED